MTEVLEFLRNLGGLLAGLILTLFIYSYLWKDNGLYRLAVHILVGVSAGYGTVVVLQSVILPRLREIQQDPVAAESLLWLVPVALSLLLLFKLLPRIAPLANSTVAALVGVGAAVALVGAIAGTLIPQLIDVSTDPGWLVIPAAISTILALSYFRFTGRATAEGAAAPHPAQRWAALAGQVILTITFAALFAGVMSTSLVLLAERIQFFIISFRDVISGFLS
jgi:hypothetical protein